MKNSGIKIEGHIGTWYTIDRAVINGKVLYLLESENFGDEAACLIVDNKCQLVMEDVWNGFDDYRETLGEE